MTNEEKQLLLKDLCARLPYGVKVHIEYGDSPYGPATVTEIDVKHSKLIFNFPIPIENCKPYLRPMSSMTREECAFYFAIDESSATCIDWLNARHFDYRGLIPMGLALEAKEGMYKTE